MRLLTHDKNGNIALETFEDGDPLPPYAILSHTWLPDNRKEVTLQDLQAGRAEDKAGYNKIRFCAKQAAADGLTYFWIDSCSIDKSSSAELTEAINSMFRWYRRSAKCYVYLTDVPDSTPNEGVLRRSRWFSRGWTLQELIAPKAVEFFAADGSHLGDRSSLEKIISEVTGVTIGALRGYPLSDFSIDERFRWAANRQTKRPEDKPYSLLGIFDVAMPSNYGEGEEKAMLRLREQINKQKRTDIDILDPSRSSASTTKRTPAYYLPPKNGRFIGRRDELQELRQKLLIDKECQKLAIVGLGGIGKTQIALEFAQHVKRERLGYSVFWVPAVSFESFEQAYTEIARILQIPHAADDKQDVKDLVKQHLSDQSAGKWLLIVDNADDMGVLFGAGSSSGVVDSLPESDDGVTVFTSRRWEVAESLVGNDVLEVNKMSEDEAMIFMTTSLARKTRTEDGPIKQLVADLDYLPLAVAQAAAYINTNKITVSKYLDLIRNTDADLMEVMSREFRDSTRYKQSSNAVATTWVVSFNQILQENADAADLLSFISCIEWKSIPLSLLPTVEPEARMTNAIGTICSYGFLTQREEEDVYDMHRLVHLATRVWLARERRETEVREAALKHLAHVFPFGGYENRELWRAYLPHALRAMGLSTDDDTAVKAELALSLGTCLIEDGRYGEAVIWLEQSCRWRDRDLVEYDSTRLLSQHELAKAYRGNGQIGEAVKLLEHVVAVKERLVEDHPSRLASQHELAIVYNENGQIGEAVKLLEHVVAVEEKLVEDHPSRLAGQHQLAVVYEANGQIDEAVKLLEHVVAVQEKLVEDHPHRLASQHALAMVYEANGQIAEAMKLLEYVVAVKEKLVEDHPLRLASQHQLAIAYQANGQIDEADKLLEHVVAVREKKLVEDHPDRLASQHALARVYEANGRIDEAVKLLEYIVAVESQKLAEDHPDRLASQHELAIVYDANGQIDEAVKLLQHVVAIKRRIYTEIHPWRIVSEKALERILHRLSASRKRG